MEVAALIPSRGQLLWMWTYLPYLHIFRQNYRNALPTIMGFHKASLLTKEVILQQRKCGNEAMLMEFTCLTVLPSS